MLHEEAYSTFSFITSILEFHGMSGVISLLLPQHTHSYIAVFFIFFPHFLESSVSYFCLKFPWFYFVIDVKKAFLDSVLLPLKENSLFFCNDFTFHRHFLVSDGSFVIASSS